MDRKEIFELAREAVNAKLKNARRVKNFISVAKGDTTNIKQEIAELSKKRKELSRAIRNI